MTSNLLGTTVADVLDEVFGDDPTELFVVDPSARAVQALVDAANAYDGDVPSIRVLGDERTLKDVMGDFIVASNAANLVEDGDLEFRVLDDDSRSAMLVTDDRTVALLETGGLVGGLATDDEGFTGTAYDAATGDWEGAEPFTLRTPAIDRVRSAEADVSQVVSIALRICLPY